MIFKIIKWSVILKAALKLKPYFRLIGLSITSFLFVSIVHSEALSFLQDTEKTDLIALTYFIKWGLNIVIILMAFIYYKKISKAHSVVVDEIKEPPSVSKPHQEILNKDKLMSKGDKILNR